jgi:hypothetical protein
VSQLTLPDGLIGHSDIEQQGAQRLRMSASQGSDICDFCGHRSVVTRFEQLAFHQWTDRGYVSCRVTVPIGTCEQCGAKSLGEAAEELIEEAARQERDKLQ